MAKKEIKTNRKNFRFTNQIKNMLELRARELGISENELTEDAILNYLEKQNNFIVCPKCRAFVYQVEKLTTPGVAEIDCKVCNCKIWYDVDEYKVLKHSHKPTPKKNKYLTEITGNGIELNAVRTLTKWVTQVNSQRCAIDVV